MNLEVAIREVRFKKLDVLIWQEVANFAQQALGPHSIEDLIHVKKTAGQYCFSSNEDLMILTTLCI